MKHLKNILLIGIAILVLGRMTFDAGWIPISISAAADTVWLAVAIIGWAAVLFTPWFRQGKEES